MIFQKSFKVIKAILSETWRFGKFFLPGLKIHETFDRGCNSFMYFSLFFLSSLSSLFLLAFASRTSRSVVDDDLREIIPPSRTIKYVANRFPEDLLWEDEELPVLPSDGQMMQEPTFSSIDIYAQRNSQPSYQESYEEVYEDSYEELYEEDVDDMIDSFFN